MATKINRATAVRFGTMAVDAMNKECAQIRVQKGFSDSASVEAVRGATIRLLTEINFIMNSKSKMSFDYDHNKFIAACGFDKEKIDV